MEWTEAKKALLKGWYVRLPEWDNYIDKDDINFKNGTYEKLERKDWIINVGIVNLAIGLNKYLEEKENGRNI